MRMVPSVLNNRPARSKLGKGGGATPWDLASRFSLVGCTAIRQGRASMALAIVDLAMQTETLRRGEDCTRSFRNPDRRRWVVGDARTVDS